MEPIDAAVHMAESTMHRIPCLNAKWAYEYNVVWKGFADVYAHTNNEIYAQYIKNGVDSFLSYGRFDEEASGVHIRGYDAEEYNLDHLANGRMILWLYERTGDARYRAAAETLLRQLEHQPRTSEGGFWHKLIYPWQMWLDGLYMHGPFYARAARLFGLDGVWDDLANQIRLFHSHARIEDSGLYAHAWDERRVQFWCDAKTGLSPHVWGRAMGWLLAAMADILEVFPAEHPSRGEIVGIFADCAQAAANARNWRTGVWQQVLDAPTRAGNYDEASASCLIEYAIAKGVRMGLLDDSFRGVIADAWRGICEQFLIEYKGLLNINKCCEVAGLGGEARRDGSYAYYLSEPIISNELKAVGALIQAGVELNSGYEAQPHLIRGVEG